MFPSFNKLQLLCGLLAIFLLPPLAANAEIYEEFEKEHSWFSFSKPAKKSPQEQMEYAEKLLRDRKTSKSARAFRSLALTWPSSTQAPMAQWAYARILDQRGKIEDAFDAYQVLMEKFPGRFPEYEKVLARQYGIATEIMNKRRGGFFFGGFAAPERAVPFFEQVIRNGPRSKFAAEAQCLIGEAYEASFQYDLAVLAFSTALHRYPESGLAERAALGRARSLFVLSQDYPNDIKSLEEAWAGVMVFIRSYPQSNNKDEAARMRDTLLERKAAADFEIARYYDHIAKKPEAARDHYARVAQLYPGSPLAEQAKQRLAEIPETEATETPVEENKL